MRTVLEKPYLTVTKEDREEIVDFLAKGGCG
jgi:hypothetical protein